MTAHNKLSIITKQYRRCNLKTVSRLDWSRAYKKKKTKEREREREETNSVATEQLFRRYYRRSKKSRNININNNTPNISSISNRNR